MGLQEEQSRTDVQLCPGRNCSRTL